MAGDTASLGKLVVELLLKDDQFKAAMGNAQNQMQSGGANLASTATAVGGKITSAFKVATAAIVAFGAATTVVGAKFEQQMAMVGALQGLQQTDKAFTDLQAQARLLGSTTEFTATQAAESLEDLARAGSSVEESIASSNNALTLAGTSGASLADSTQLLIAAQRQFGLESAESERITNVFSLAMRKSLLDFTSVREAMKFAGSTGKSFGMTLEETTASVAAFRDLGLEGSLAGNSFKMAMNGAAKATAKKDAALKKYGLTMADISPEQNTFIDIVEKMAEVGLTATDAIEVFGRSGANVALLAAETAKGNVKMREMTSTLMDASKEGNTAADMYKTLSQTVAFASKVAMSALQDLMIEVFQTFAGPLRELIETLPDVLNAVTAALKVQGPAIRKAFADTLGGIAKLLKDNGQALADGFVNLIKILADLGPMLVALSQVLVVIARNADLVVGALAFGTVVVAAVKLVAVVNSLGLALGGATTAVGAFGVALTVSTGGLFAAAAAVGAIVAALIVYISTVVKARKNTDQLRAAQAQLSAQAEAMAASEEKRLDSLLQKQQAQARKELESGKELSKSREEALKQILGMDAATARQAKASGDLVETNTGLVTVQEALNDSTGMGRDLVMGLAEQDEAEAKALGKKIRMMEKVIAAREGDTDGAKDAAAKQIIGAKLDRADITNMNDAIAVLEDLRAKRDQVAGRASNLRNQAATERRGQLKAQTNAEFEALRAEHQGTVETVDAGVDNRAAAADRIRDIQRQLAADQAKVERDVEAEIQASLDSRLAKIREAFNEGLAAAEGNAQEIAGLEKQKAQAEDQARDIATTEQKAHLKREADAAREAAKEAAEAQREAALEAAEAQVAAQARANAELERLGVKHVSRREQLQREISLTMAELTEASVDDQVAAIRKLRKEYKVGLVEGIRNAANAVKDFGAAAVGAAKSAASAVGDLLNKMAGLDFSMQAVAQNSMDMNTAGIEAQAAAQADIAAAQKRLAEAQASGNTDQAAEAASDLAAAKKDKAAAAAGIAGGGAGFAVEFVDSLMAQADTFTDLFVESVGPALEQLAADLPDLLIKIATETIPGIFDALVENLPDLIMGVIDSLPDLFTALIRGATDLIVMLLGLLPEMLTTLLTDVLPTLISELVRALPILITAVVDAVPKILVAISDAIPVIIAAVIDALPTIIFALISALPRVWAAIIGALPEIVFAFVDGMWKLVWSELPKTVGKLWTAIIEGSGEALKAIANGIWEGLTGFLNLGQGKGGKGEGEEDKFFKNLFGKKGKDGSAGAFSGISYVPATMRMTLHKGEAVVDASRNAQNMPGQTAPAPAGAAQNGMGGGGGGGGGPVDIAVIVEGRMLDAVQIQAAQRGGAVGVQKEIRRSSGVRVGLSRGKFNAWSK